MACYGKFWGTIIGGLVSANIVGAAIGFVAGHILVDIPAQAYANKNRAAQANAQAQQLTDIYRKKFLRIWSGMVAKLAKADGNISREEIQVIETYFTAYLELNSESRAFAIEAFNAAKDSPYDFEHYANDFVTFVGDNKPVLRAVLGMLVGLAAADGQVNRAEEAILQSAARIFGVSLQEFESFLRTQSSKLDHYYAILGCSESDDNETIKARYRQLVKENHPDVIAGKGLPPEFINYATKKFQEIQEAYAEIRKQRGFR